LNGLILSSGPPNPSLMQEDKTATRKELVSKLKELQRQEEEVILSRVNNSCLTLAFNVILVDDIFD